MIRAADCVKRFHSAKVRFFEGVLNNFFKCEFPKQLGPILRRKLVEELYKAAPGSVAAKRTREARSNRLERRVCQNPGGFTECALCSGDINHDR
jgi:hypothetical protein